MKRFVAMCIIFALFSGAALAQTIVNTKSGQVIEGTLIEQTDDYVKMNVSGVELTYWMDDIESLELSDGRVIRPGLSVPVSEDDFSYSQPQSYQEPYSAEPQTDQPAWGESQEPSYSSTPSFDSTPVPVDDWPDEADFGDSTVAPFGRGMTSLPFADAGGAVLLFFIITALLLGYVYPAVCLQLTAQKCGVENGWFAWVPVLNLILMCDVARKPRWWAALYLLAFVPFAGIIAVTVITVLIYMAISENRGKPGWLGILMIVPFVSLFVIGYLAFSE